jgi:hypothetical protein
MVIVNRRPDSSHILLTVLAIGICGGDCRRSGVPPAHPACRILFSSYYYSFKLLCSFHVNLGLDKDCNLTTRKRWQTLLRVNMIALK